MARPNPTFEQLITRLTQLQPSAHGFSGVVYRSSTPKYARQSELLTGEGSRRHGGRWNPVGIAVVYASLSPATAMAEALAHNRYYGIAIEEAMPRTFVAIEVTLAMVIDISQGLVRQRLQVSLERLRAVDWRKDVQTGRKPMTQRIGHSAAEAGIEALIVPSAVDHHGLNLLVFPQNLRPKSELRVLHPERLG